MEGRIVIAVLALGFSGAANANTQPNTYSASQVMPACRDLTSDDFIEQGVCLGALHALRAASGKGVGYCIPSSATEAQLIRVALDYIDRVPTRMNEPFDVLALEAFRAHWSCR